MKHYYKGIEERDATPAFQQSLEREFDDVPEAGMNFSRRNFLKLAGFSVAAAMAPGCSRAPSEALVPYSQQPEGIVAGQSVWYASTCGGCSAGCGILAKNRDGRPIKLEGNPGHPVSSGGLCSVGQAMILPLYDSERLKVPMRKHEESDWKSVDKEIGFELAKIKSGGGAVRFLTGTVNSPTAKASIDAFLAGFRDARHVSYDALSSSAILDAHQRTHGARVLPSYAFESAELIVSFDADFLGTWISPVEFTKAYHAGRKLDGKRSRLSRHVQFESRLSLTGSNADQRIAVSPHELGVLVTGLALRLAKLAGKRLSVSAPKPPAAQVQRLDALAKALWAKRGRSLVVCGVNQRALQTQINWINHVLRNYEKTLSVKRPSQQRMGNDAELAGLLAEIKAGKVAALFVHGCNPVFELAWLDELHDSIDKLELAVSFAPREDETAQAAHFVCPEHHPLESWQDSEPVVGVLTVSQPTIRPLGKTRSLTESLAVWGGAAKPAYHIMREHWKTQLFKRQKKYATFNGFWDNALHNGHTAITAAAPKLKAFDVAAVKAAKGQPAPGGDKLALVLYPKAALLAGQHAHNPWLQELPDPVSKVVWDNYAAVSPALASRLKLEHGDVVKLGAGKTELELPVHIQPGQDDATVAVALGYGREGTDRFGKVGPQWIEARPTVATGGSVGVNASGLLSLAGGVIRYVASGVKLAKTGKRSDLVTTQIHHSLSVPKHLASKGEGKRPFVQETTLPEYRKNPRAGAPHAHEIHDLWPENHAYTGHHWGLMIDLAACTGCSACVLACQAENNVPVVGQDEVRRNREMHWLRIDRYYADGPDGTDVVHQPMMCQQCDHAPCETVCPVLATVHSSEGLNQQIYNRCVGTRYCSNNCPYKTRRFNWFDYPHEDRLQNMSLNPDVTIRSRGVMEKCTFCVQRIQEAKAAAKSKGVKLADGDIQPACQQSCPADAIVFGDMNDKKSKVSELKADPRRYRVLDELGVEPSVGYLRIVRNREQSKGAKHHE